jgi:predicted transcriptional regulator
MKLGIKLTTAVMCIRRDDEISCLTIMVRTIQANPCACIALRFLQRHSDGVAMRF